MNDQDQVPVEAEEVVEAAATEETQSEPTEEPKEERKVPRGVQKRLDELTRRIHEERSEKERLIGLLESRQPVDSGNAPDRGDFENYEDYLEARAEYKAEQKINKVLADRDDKVRKSQEQDRQGKMADSWAQKTDTARERYPDFDAVTMRDDITVSQQMAQAMLAMDDGADIAYYLGKNQNEAERLAKLDSISVAIEIGKLASKIATLEKTKAPPPITPVGAARSGSKDPERMSVNEWMDWRGKQKRT